jgi:hypothetical protein
MQKTIMITLILASIVLFKLNRDLDTKASAKAPAEPTGVMLAHFDWRRQFGDQSMTDFWLGDFQIRNDTGAAVKDVRIDCIQHAPSGTAIGTSSETVYQTFRRHSTRTVAGLRMGLLEAQVATVSCSVASWKPTE